MSQSSDPAGDPANDTTGDSANEPIDALRADLDALLDRHASPSPLDDDARTRLVAFVLLLAKWNRVWNLTAVRDAQAMLERHVLDSLSLLPFVDEALRCADVPDLLDIGSGAGLPVLPLAIVRPTLSCLSVERTEKKARFQRQAVLELSLAKVQVLAQRIETLDRRASIVTSRAFTAPEAFLALAAGHVAPGGRALIMLGRVERLPDVLPPPFRLDRLQRIDAHQERHVAVCIADA